MLRDQTCNREERLYSRLSPTAFTFAAGILASTSVNLLSSILDSLNSLAKYQKASTGLLLLAASLALFAVGSVADEFKRAWERLGSSPQEVRLLLGAEGRADRFRWRLIIAALTGFGALLNIFMGAWVIS